MTTQRPVYTDEEFDTAAAERSDAELITAVRSGDEFAYATLWSRHEHAARRLARQISNPSNADDLVSESFLRVLRALKSGNGPDGAFRPYLFSTLRRINIDNGRSYYTRVALTDDERDLDLDLSDSAADTMADNADGSAAWRAWNSLPDSSKTLLWHLLIEEETPAQIAPLIGTTPNGVSSRAVRAKERLRQAFLQQHLLDADNPECRQARSRMGEYVRDALSNRDRIEVRAHLDGCARCQAALFEISDLNQTMRVLIAPVVLGGIAVAGHYLAATSAVAGAAKGSLLGHLLTKGLKNPAMATAAAAAVVVVGVGAAYGITAATSDPTKPVAVAPIVHSSALASTPPSSNVAIPPIQTPTTIPSHTPTHAPSTPPSTPPPTKIIGGADPPVVTPTHAIIVQPPKSTPTMPAPVAFTETTLSDLEVVPTEDSTSAGVDFEPDSGWTITNVIGPSGMTCDAASGTAVHCELAAPVSAGTKTFGVTLRALTRPASTTSMLSWTYTDDNATVSQLTPIPAT
jgi:RNA polymerase sigma factor (sigma-70 family)